MHARKSITGPSRAIAGSARPNCLPTFCQPQAGHWPGLTKLRKLPLTFASNLPATAAPALYKCGAPIHQPNYFRGQTGRFWGNALIENTSLKGGIRHLSLFAYSHPSLIASTAPSNFSPTPLPEPSTSATPLQPTLSQFHQFAIRHHVRPDPGDSRGPLRVHQKRDPVHQALHQAYVPIPYATPVLLGTRIANIHLLQPTGPSSSASARPSVSASSSWELSVSSLVSRPFQLRKPRHELTISRRAEYDSPYEPPSIQRQY